MAERGAATPPPIACPVVDGAVLREEGMQATARVVGGQPPLASMDRVGARGRAPSAAERGSIRVRRNYGRRFRDCNVNPRRFGDNLSVGNSRHHRSPDYNPDYNVSHTDSFDHCLSSSDKENVVPRRKRMLDDALFEFFSKEAVKSLKTNFSNFCNDSDIWPKNKRFKSHDIGRDQFVSYSIKYYWDVLNCLTVRRKEVIRNFGFACLLKFERTEVPSRFTRWLASCVDHVSSQIIIDDCKVIPISKDFLHHIIGLPNSGTVPMPDSDRGAKLILSLFGLTELPHITFFGNKLKSKEVLTDKEVFVCFMVVAFKCFLFPTVDGYPNTDYLSILEDPASASGVDLCFLVYEHLISGVSKFNRSCKLNGRKPKCFEFCYYALSVHYLDSLDFGVRTVDQSVPRMPIWKGNLIKFFSELDYKKNNCFGKRQLKINLAHCHTQLGVTGDYKCDNHCSANVPETCFSAGFEEALHIRFGNTLESKVIDGIIDSVKCAELAKLRDIPKCELLVNNLLNFIVTLNPSDVKGPIPENNVLARDTSTGTHDQADTASHLNLISPNVFCKSGSGSLIGSSLHSNPASPDILISDSSGINTFKTAPVLQPVNKVKSRLDNGLPIQQAALTLNTFPAGVKDSRSSSFLWSPISHFTLSPSSHAKDSNGLLIPGSNTIVSGSKEVPISVPDHSPKTHLESDVLCVAGSNMNVAGSKEDPIPVSDPPPKVDAAIPSQEVFVNASSSFSFRQVELAKKGDALYNSMSNIVVNTGKEQCTIEIADENNDDAFVDLSQEALQHRIAKDDLVILQPKNSLILPLAQNGRFPVSDSDIKNYCAIVDLAYTRGIQKSYVVKYPKVHCSYISLGQSLMPGGHVDNFLIPVFCRKLFEDNHPSKSGRHHFFSLVGESILDYENDAQLAFVSKALNGAALASKRQRLESSDRLFFPICRDRHWFTFSVDLKYKCFVFLDSLYNKDDYFHTSIKKRMINNFVKIWKIAFKTEENMFKKFGVMYANVPKQDNVDDCGVFTMKFMEIFKPELDMRRFFSKADIINIRIQIVNKLFLCKRNNADKSVVFDYVSQ